MSIEAAFRKVSEEIGSQSVRAGRGTDADHRRAVLSAGSPPGLRKSRQAHRPRRRQVGLHGACSRPSATARRSASTLRVMAQENRDMRMSEAEKKAAGLPPKLTVPMILFFLPVLFVVILGPAAIKVMAICNSAAQAPHCERPRSVRIERSAPVAPAAAGRLLVCLAAPASAADRRHWRRLRPAAGRRAAIFSASAKRPCRPTTSARFWRTFGLGVRLRRRPPQGDLGALQVLRERVGQAEIGQDRRLVRHDLERRSNSGVAPPRGGPSGRAPRLAR